MIIKLCTTQLHYVVALIYQHFVIQHALIQTVIINLFLLILVGKVNQILLVLLYFRLSDYLCLMEKIFRPNPNSFKNTFCVFHEESLDSINGLELQYDSKSGSKYYYTKIDFRGNFCIHPSLYVQLFCACHKVLYSGGTNKY